MEMDERLTIEPDFGRLSVLVKRCCFLMAIPLAYRVIMYIPECKRAIYSLARTDRRIRAATLIELLVVIALIGLLISMLIPSLKQSMDVASSTMCKHHLRELYQSVQMYRIDSDGWMPTVVDPKRGVSGLRRPASWFAKLYPTYLPEPRILTCPKDPYKYRMAPAGSRFEEDVRTDYSSYGLNSFIMTAGNGIAADMDRQLPSRPGDTIMVADIGPDRPTMASQVAGVSGPARNYSLLAWDDGFDPFSGRMLDSWLTQRHNNGIHVLTIAGGVRSANTSEMMKRPVRRYYESCAAGGCTFCNDFRIFHYSFARDHLYWWTGSPPTE